VPQERTPPHTMVRTAAVLLLTTFSPTHGWVATTQSVYGGSAEQIEQMWLGVESNLDARAQLGFLWYAPENSRDTRGLGGSITYAFDPEFCPRINKRFREDAFGGDSVVGCPEIKAAVARAFDKWAANHRFLHFLDMTHECETAGVNARVARSDALKLCSAGTRPEGCTMPHYGCPMAEIWITYADTDSESTGGTAVATAQPHASYVTDFRYTNGHRPFTLDSNGVPKYDRRVVETFAGTFKFNTHSVCWYLDSKFCAPFHRLKRDLGSPNNARLLVWGLTYGLTALALLFYSFLFLRMMMRFFNVCEDEDEERDAAGRHVDDEDGDGELSCRERCLGALRAISHLNPMLLTIFILLLVLPPLLTTRIFAPCFDCYDFEAAALHEIGHFLGLGHPDNIPDNFVQVSNDAPVAGNNSYQADIAHAMLAGVRPNVSAFCNNPWANVRAGIPPGAETDMDKLGVRYPTRDAQMEARTQHNPRTCLFDDDLEALAVLYPDCDQDLAMFEAVCHEVNLNIGIVRMSIYVLIPSLIALFFVITCNSVVHCFERRERVRLAELAAEKEDALEARLQDLAKAHAKEVEKLKNNFHGPGHHNSFPKKQSTRGWTGRRKNDNPAKNAVDTPSSTYTDVTVQPQP